MNTNRTLIAALLFATAMATGGCANFGQESTGQAFDDTTITTQVKAKLVEDHTTSALDIHVTTFKGAVQLAGFVRTPSEADRAVALAREVKGVQSVKNDMRIASR